MKLNITNYNKLETKLKYFSSILSVTSFNFNTSYTVYPTSTAQAYHKDFKIFFPLFFNFLNFNYLG